MNADNLTVIGRRTGNDVQIDTGSDDLAMLMVGMIAAELGASRRTEQGNFIISTKHGAIVFNHMEKPAFVNTQLLAPACTAVDFTDIFVHFSGSERKLSLF